MSSEQAAGVASQLVLGSALAMKLLEAPLRRVAAVHKTWLQRPTMNSARQPRSTQMPLLSHPQVWFWTQGEPLI